MRRSCLDGDFPSKRQIGLEDSQKILLSSKSEKEPSGFTLQPSISKTLATNPTVSKWSEEKILVKRSNYSKKIVLSGSSKRRSDNFFLEEMKSGKVSTILDWYSDFQTQPFCLRTKRNSPLILQIIFLCPRSNDQSCKKGHSNLHKLYSHSQIYSPHRCNPRFVEAGESRITQVVAEREEKTKLRKSLSRINCGWNGRNHLLYLPAKNPVRASTFSWWEICNLFKTTRQKQNKPTKFRDLM